MTELKLYGPFETAADLPVGTWFIPADKTDVPCMAYRGSGHVDLLYAEGFPAHRHRGDLGEVRVAAVVGMPSQSGVPMCTLPLAEWLEWAWVRFDGITGEACLSHLKEEVQELDEAVTHLNRAKASSSDIKVYGPHIDEVAEEASDVIALALHTAIRLVGTNLPTAMHRKLAVNRGRDWSPRADGSLRHVEPEPEGGYDHCENAENDAKAFAHTVAWAAGQLGLSVPDDLAPDAKLEQIVDVLKGQAAGAKDVTRRYADLKLRLTTCLGLDAGEALETIVAHAEGHADWAKAMQRVVEAAGVGCWRQDPSVYADRIIARLFEGDARAERTAKAYADFRGKAGNAEQRSRTLATIEGLLGCGKDEAIKTPVEAQQRLRHHIGDAVLASLASAVGADEQTLTSIDAAIARLMKYGRYRAECGQPIMPGHVVATGAGDSMLVGRVFLVDAEGKETSMLTSDLTWAASGMVLTGFGGARTVTVSGPLTFLGWR